jgi:hypothetical protein
MRAGREANNSWQVDAKGREVNREGGNRPYWELTVVYEL